MIEESDIDEMHPAGAWEANEWTDNGEDEVNETNEQPDVEKKWVRVQASLDELGDALAVRLRTIVLKVGEGDTLTAVELLEELIEAVEVFSGQSEAEE